MSDQQNNQDRPLHPVELEIARLLLESVLEMRRDEEKKQCKKEEENRDLRKAKLQARAKRRWKKIEQLEREGKLPVCLWMTESKRIEEEVGYGLCLLYTQSR